MDLSVFFAGTAGSVPTARRGLPALLVRAGRGPDPVRLRRGDAAPAGQLGRAARPDRDLPHPLPRRPLAGPARDAEDVRPARPRADRSPIYGPRGLRELIGLGAAGRRAGAASSSIWSSSSPATMLERDGYRIAAVPGLAPRAGVRLRAVRGRAPGRVRSRAARAARPAPRARSSAASSAARRSAASRPSRCSGRRGPAASSCSPATRRPCEALRIAAHEADVLVHEATFAEEERERAARDRPLDRRPGGELVAPTRRGRAARAQPRLHPLPARRAPRRGARDLRPHGPAARLRHDRDPVRRARRAGARPLATAAPSTRSRQSRRWPRRMKRERDGSARATRDGADDGRAAQARAAARARDLLVLTRGWRARCSAAGAPATRRRGRARAWRRSSGHWERHGFGLWLLRDRAERVVRRPRRPPAHGRDRPATRSRPRWAIVPERWGQGLATELAVAAVEVGFGALDARCA